MTLCFIFLFYLLFKVQAMDKVTEPGGNILRLNAIIQHDEIFHKIVESSSLWSR